LPAPVDITDPFRALSDPTRREILSLLATGALPVRMIANCFPSISRPAVSKHLRILREGGLVSEERSGRERYYRLELDTVETTLDWMSSVSARAGGVSEAKRARRAEPRRGARAKSLPKTGAHKRRKPAMRKKPMSEVQPPVESEPAETGAPVDAGVDSSDWKAW
jgi:DNA-binding transcriptional ArsR family regulator